MYTFNTLKTRKNIETHDTGFTEKHLKLMIKGFDSLSISRNNRSFNNPTTSYSDIVKRDSISIFMFFFSFLGAHHVCNFVVCDLKYP